MTGHQMGNKFAHEDFKNRSASKGGIHLAMDANDFKSINDKYGHETGDTAIKALGSAMRGAMDEAALEKVSFSGLVVMSSWLMCLLMSMPLDLPGLYVIV
jgi:predicted signal transduction protein with EAL and GGDEF domain